MTVLAFAFKMALLVAGIVFFWRRVWWPFFKFIFRCFSVGRPVHITNTDEIAAKVAEKLKDTRVK